MKLATYLTGSGLQAIGSVDTARGTVLDLQASHRLVHGKVDASFQDMLALIDGGDAALERAQALLARAPEEALAPLSSVKLLSPVPQPRQIRDFNNAESHWRNAPAGMRMLRARLAGEPVPRREEIEVTVPEVNFAQPNFYISNRFNVIGTDTDVQWPTYSQWFDYEIEFGIFLGRTGKNIRKADAASHIFGYAVFNDFTARDKQIREMEGSLGPTKGKSFDSGNAIGPWITTRDEIADARKLGSELRVNGESWGRCSSSCMVHSFEDMLVHVSDNETVYAGEFFGSGTMAGGCSLETDRWLKDGDTVEIEFEGLGVLRNRVRRNG